MPFVNHSDSAAASGEERKRTRDYASLVDQLSDPNPTSRRWAARDLAQCPEGALELVARLKNETDLSVREVIFSTLTTLKNREAIEGLIDCLRSEDAALRNETIEAMQQCPEEVGQFIQLLFTDADPDVRIFAVNILESLCHGEVESWLIGVISTDQNLNVCATAVGVLTEIGTAASCEPLMAVSRRFANEPFLTFAVELALKRICEQKSNE